MPSITSTPGFWRIAAFFTGCAAVLGYWMAGDAKRLLPYREPVKNPDLGDVALTVHGYLIIPAFVGSLLLIAIVNRSAALGRAILILTAIVSIGVGRILHAFYGLLPELTVSTLKGADERFTTTTYLMALLFGTIVPLGLALIAWPKPQMATAE